MMKKSTFGAILAFLFAAAGALTAAALYLRRRERNWTNTSACCTAMTATIMTMTTNICPSTMNRQKPPKKRLLTMLNKPEQPAEK